MWLRDLMKQAASLANKFVASALNEDERYAKAVVTCLAAVTYADGEVDDGEMVAAYGFIEGLDVIRDNLGEDRAKELFASELARFEKMATMCGGTLGGPVGGMEIKKVAQQIADEVPSKDNREMVLAIAQQMASSDGSVAKEEEAVIKALRSKMA